MLRVTVSKIKRACTFSLIPRLLRGEPRNGFERLTANTVHVAEKNTQSGDQDDDTEANKIIDRIFNPKVREKERQRIVRIVQKEQLEKFNKILQLEQHENFKSCECILKDTGDCKEERVIPLHANAQATTAKENEEKLEQKIEIVNETPLVEAQTEVEGFNTSPRVLGEKDLKIQNLHVSRDPTINTPRDNLEVSLDKLAKTCVDKPASPAEKNLLDELGNFHHSLGANSSEKPLSLCDAPKSHLMTEQFDENKKVLNDKVRSLDRRNTDLGKASDPNLISNKEQESNADLRSTEQPVTLGNAPKPFFISENVDDKNIKVHSKLKSSNQLQSLGQELDPNILNNKESEVADSRALNQPLSTGDTAETSLTGNKEKERESEFNAELRIFEENLLKSGQRQIIEASIIHAPHTSKIKNDKEILLELQQARRRSACIIKNLCKKEEPSLPQGNENILCTIIVNDANKTLSGINEDTASTPLVEINKSLKEETIVLDKTKNISEVEVAKVNNNLPQPTETIRALNEKTKKNLNEKAQLAPEKLIVVDISGTDKNTSEIEISNKNSHPLQPATTIGVNNNHKKSPGGADLEQEYAKVVNTLDKDKSTGDIELTNNNKYSTELVQSAMISNEKNIKSIEDSYIKQEKVNPVDSLDMPKNGNEGNIKDFFSQTVDNKGHCKNDIALEEERQKLEQNKPPVFNVLNESEKTMSDTYLPKSKQSLWKVNENTIKGTSLDEKDTKEQKKEQIASIGDINSQENESTNTTKNIYHACNTEGTTQVDKDSLEQEESAVVNRIHKDEGIREKNIVHAEGELSNTPHIVPVVNKEVNIPLLKVDPEQPMKTTSVIDENKDALLLDDKKSTEKVNIIGEKEIAETEKHIFPQLVSEVNKEEIVQLVETKNEEKPELAQSLLPRNENKKVTGKSEDDDAVKQAEVVVTSIVQNNNVNETLESEAHLSTPAQSVSAVNKEENIQEEMTENDNTEANQTTNLEMNQFNKDASEMNNKEFPEVLKNKNNLEQKNVTVLNITHTAEVIDEKVKSLENFPVLIKEENSQTQGIDKNVSTHDEQMTIDQITKGAPEINDNKQVIQAADDTNTLEQKRSIVFSKDEEIDKKETIEAVSQGHLPKPEHVEVENKKENIQVDKNVLNKTENIQEKQRSVGTKEFCQDVPVRQDYKGGALPLDDKNALEQEKAAVVNILLKGKDIDDKDIIETEGHPPKSLESGPVGPVENENERINVAGYNILSRNVDGQVINEHKGRTVLFNYSTPEHEAATDANITQKSKGLHERETVITKEHLPISNKKEMIHDVDDILDTYVNTREQIAYKDINQFAKALPLINGNKEASALEDDKNSLETKNETIVSVLPKGKEIKKDQVEAHISKTPEIIQVANEKEISLQDQTNVKQEQILDTIALEREKIKTLVGHSELINESDAEKNENKEGIDLVNKTNMKIQNKIASEKKMTNSELHFAKPTQTIAVSNKKENEEQVKFLPKNMLQLLSKKEKVEPVLENDLTQEKAIVDTLSKHEIANENEITKTHQHIFKHMAQLTNKNDEKGPIKETDSLEEKSKLFASNELEITSKTEMNKDKEVSNPNQLISEQDKNEQVKETIALKPEKVTILNVLDKNENIDEKDRDKVDINIPKHIEQAAHSFMHEATAKTTSSQSIEDFVNPLKEGSPEDLKSQQPAAEALPKKDAIVSLSQLLKWLRERNCNEFCKEFALANKEKDESNANNVKGQCLVKSNEIEKKNDQPRP